jgi:hypothetical protein
VLEAQLMQFDRLFFVGGRRGIYRASLKTSLGFAIFCSRHGFRIWFICVLPHTFHIPLDSTIYLDSRKYKTKNYLRLNHIS